MNFTINYFSYKINFYIIIKKIDYKRKFNLCCPLYVIKTDQLIFYYDN